MIFKLPKFSAIPNLVHGFSTREFGSMRPKDQGSSESLKKFLSALSLPLDKTVRMHQIHSNALCWVIQKDRGTIIDQTDGLLTQGKDIFLMVVVGDCVPLLFFDKQKEYSGVAHAGWRGVFNNIAGKTILEFVEAGSNPKDILVGIGPCIRSCCYKVGNERVEQFQKKFRGKKCIIREDYLDLPGLLTQQLEEVGVPLENIDDAKICTADAIDKFYSYRKEGEEFGEFIGVIGVKKSAT